VHRNPGLRNSRLYAPKGVPKTTSIDILFTRVRVLNVLKVRDVVGQSLKVRFGPPRDKRKLTYPYTPSQVVVEHQPQGKEQGT
jgi:hypothetical protein